MTPATDLNEAVVLLLTSARDRIAVPGAWTQHASARDTTGERVSVFDEEAVCWCMTGSLVISTLNYPSGEQYALAVRALRLAIGATYKVSALAGDSIVMYNDAKGQTQTGAVEAFDIAIALVKEKAK